MQNLFLFTGRGQRSKDLALWFEKYEKHFNVIPMEPPIEWYSRPNGVNDQQASIESLKLTVQSLATKIKNYFPYTKPAFAGFSAGAVVALELSFQMEVDFVIVNSGAILNFGHNKDISDSKTKYYIHHDIRDQVFTWQERCLPMLDYLKYNDIEVILDSNGLHSLSDKAIEYFLNRICLGNLLSTPL